MKIRELDIYGYGKWINQRFELDDHLQVITGQNEAGKSTLQSFIRSILFGFPSKRRRIQQINRYEPRHAEVYGGRILLEKTALGDVWVERTNKGLHVTTRQGDPLADNSLDQILGGLDEQLFDSFYAFSLQNLQELANIDADRLSDYFLSIGTIGSEKFLAVAKAFDKEAEALFKSKGKKPPLNQLLEDHDQSQQARLQLRNKMSEYNQLLAQQQVELQAIQDLHGEVGQLEESLRQVDKLMGRYDVFLKEQAAQRELQRLTYTEMPKDLPDQLKALVAAQKVNQGRIEQMQERIQTLNQEMTALTRLNWARNHEAQRRQWLSATRHIKEVQSRLELVLERIQEQTQQLARMAQEGQFYPDKVLELERFDQQLTQGYELQAQLEDLQGQADSLKAQRKVFLDQRRELQTYSATVRQQYAKLENQRLNEEEVLIQATRLNHYLPALIAIVIAGAVGLFYYFNQAADLYKWIAIILGGLGGLGSLYVFWHHRQHHLHFRRSPVVDKMAELSAKDKDYQARSMDLGVDINQREASLRQVNQAIEAQKQDLQRWLVSIGFYPTAYAEFILKSNPIKAYKETFNIRQQYEDERNQLNVEIINWRHQIAPLLERFPFDDTMVRPLIRHIEEVEVSLARQSERGQAMEERIQHARDVMEQAQAEIKIQQNQIDQIYQQTNAVDELDFTQKVQMNQRIQELNEKRSLYADQLAGYEEELEAIENKHALVSAYQDLEVKLSQTKDRLQPHQYQRANIEVALNHLEQDGSYQVLDQKIADQRAEIIDYFSEYATRKLATELIYQTLRHGMDNPLPEMNRMANSIFSDLTYGRYDKIKLNKSGLKVQHCSDVLFEPHELSQGTLEQLYVALRLAFIVNASSMVKMPILIDDAFVNFDELRKKSMYQVLTKFSKDYQILFFTFDPQVQETMAIDQVIELEDYQSDEDEMPAVSKEE